VDGYELGTPELTLDRRPVTRNPDGTVKETKGIVPSANRFGVDRLVHRWLVPWHKLDELWDGETARRMTSDTVTDTLDILRIHGAPLWRTARRIGKAESIVELDRATDIITEDGVLQGLAGDFVVTFAGVPRIVAAELLPNEYDPRTLDRIGVVHVRPALAGETVLTREGPQIAPRGGWIVRGVKGHQWPVSAAALSAGYSLSPFVPWAPR
jgi:hypothetical protein